MKQIAFILPLMAILTIVPAANAVNGDGQGSSMGQNQQAVTAQGTTGEGNQNMVKTQNQGEDQMLQVESQEMEGELGDNQMNQNGNGNGIQEMSQVALQVQQLLKLGDETAIGQQVREVAQNQQQAQSQIRTQVDKIATRSQFVKSLLGPDYAAINGLKQQIEENQLRIKQLEELKLQMQNEGDDSQIQATIEAMIQQNTALQEKIQAEEGVKSMFGWLFRFFNQQ